MTDTSRAPRVTTEQVEQAIASEHYFSGLDGVMSKGGTGKQNVEPTGPVADPSIALGLCTICILVLRNGYTVVGTSACASPEIFDAQIGRNVAREAAIDKVWPLLGYALKSELHKTQEAFNHGYQSPDR